MSKRSIRDCLDRVGVTAELVQGLESVDAEWVMVKKSYSKLVLATHPDKGGDPVAFRDVREAWETIRATFDKGKIHASGFSVSCWRPARVPRRAHATGSIHSLRRFLRLTPAVLLFVSGQGRRGCGRAAAA